MAKVHGREDELSLVPRELMSAKMSAERVLVQTVVPSSICRVSELSSNCRLLQYRLEGLGSSARSSQIPPTP